MDQLGRLLGSPVAGVCLFRLEGCSCSCASQFHPYLVLSTYFCFNFQPIPKQSEIHWDCHPDYQGKKHRKPTNRLNFFYPRFLHLDSLQRSQSMAQSQTFPSSGVQTLTVPQLTCLNHIEYRFSHIQSCVIRV